LKVAGFQGTLFQRLLLTGKVIVSGKAAERSKGDHPMKDLQPVIRIVTAITALLIAVHELRMAIIKFQEKPRQLKNS